MGWFPETERGSLPGDMVIVFKRVRRVLYFLVDLPFLKISNLTVMLDIYSRSATPFQYDLFKSLPVFLSRTRNGAICTT